MSEKPADKGVSAEEVSLATVDRVTEKGKVDAANVGGDSETPDSAGRDGNITAEDSGKAGAPAGALGNIRTS